MRRCNQFPRIALPALLTFSLAAAGCSDDPFDKAECTQDPDVEGYECENGFVVRTSDAGPADGCRSRSEEQFCREEGTPGVIDCKEVTAADECGRERTVDCEQFIDLQSSDDHCGACGNACDFPNSQSQCVDGSCEIESCTGDYVDLDGDSANGCECKPTEEVCNGKDDDCDGRTDDPWQAQLGTACDGQDDDECKNGQVVCAPDGMGTQCGTESPAGITETCNGKDNDCDGKIDETFKGRSDKPNLGEPCDGPDDDQCKAGEWACAGGGDSLTCENDMKKDETCDGRDNDCDGTVDEGFDKETLYLDSDDDGHGDKSKPKEFCENRQSDPKNYVVIDENDKDKTADQCDNDTNNWTETGCKQCKDEDGDGYYNKKCDRYDSIDGPDCNDNTALASPGETEGDSKMTCDNLDNDCDGTVDDFQFQCQGNDTGACKPGFKKCESGTVSQTCQNKVEPEPEDCSDGVDNDCDGNVDETDLSIDETCNGEDDNCDGKVDKTQNGDPLTEDCTGELPTARKGVCSSLKDLQNRKVTCSNGQYPNCDTLVPSSYVPDENANDDPNSPDCDGKDNDCDGTVDEGCRCTYSNNSDKQGVCTNGVIDSQGDCQPPSDFEADEQTCDTKDNDCDGQTDEGCDDDGDGWCDETMKVPAKIPLCEGMGEDCADDDKLRNPGAQEICNEKDMNCDGQTGSVAQPPSQFDADKQFWCETKYGPYPDKSDSEPLRCWEPGERDGSGPNGLNQGWCCEEDFAPGDPNDDPSGPRQYCDFESDCGNGYDEDRDGKTDCKDPDCDGLWCAPNKVCKNDTCQKK